MRVPDAQSTQRLLLFMCKWRQKRTDIFSVGYAVRPFLDSDIDIHVYYFLEI